MIRRFFALFSVSSLIFAGSITPVFASVRTPVVKPNSILYPRSADQYASALIIDAGTGKRLYQYLPDRKWSGASLTKLMTALVTVERGPNWSKRMSFVKSDEVGGARLIVWTGSSATVKQLLYSALVASANNAAMALSRSTGLTQTQFVAAMNAKAKALGMTNSHYVEPSGMDPANTITATDISKLASVAFNTWLIHSAATTMKYSFTAYGPTLHHTLTNTDRLLTRDPDMYVLGGKTGFLYESRYNLVVKMRTMSNDPDKPPLLVVVLGSPGYQSSFDTAKSLANWAWASYKWESQ